MGSPTTLRHAIPSPTNQTKGTNQMTNTYCFNYSDTFALLSKVTPHVFPESHVYNISFDSAIERALSESVNSLHLDVNLADYRWLLTQR